MEIFAIFLLVLVIYHHVGYPVLLKLIARYKNSDEKGDASHHRGYINTAKDKELPSIHIIVPAFNEEAVIQQKIESMIWLDYPSDKLSISIYCDGCTDETVTRAINSQQLFHNGDLDIRIVNIEKNKGKVSIINRGISDNIADIIVFSDTSAILSSDTLIRTVGHFKGDSDVAVVTGDYSLLTAVSKQGDVLGTEGELAYWQYQNKVRNLESKLGATMGVTGAYYAIRSEYCRALEEDTINDDFIMPMRAVERGGKAIFDADIKIFETEATPLEDDAKRRVRISQGNMQQIIRLKALLLPGTNLQRFWVSWMFISGKFLRVIMSYILIMLLILSAILSIQSAVFLFLFLGQVCAYSLAIMNYLVTKGTNTSTDTSAASSFDAKPIKKLAIIVFDNKISRLVSYLCQGHLMGLIGSASYLHSMFKLHVLGINSDQRWHKVEIKKND